MKRIALIVGLLAAAGCSGSSAAEPASTAAPPPSSTSAAPTSSLVTTSAAPGEIVPGGCARFDLGVLGELTGVGVPLAVIQEDSTGNRLICSVNGSGNERDANVRIEVQPLAMRREGFFRTAGEFESPIVIDTTAGVGTGRGSLRAQLDDERGLTLTVTLRTRSGAQGTIRDGDYLDIRDAVAGEVVSRLLER